MSRHQGRKLACAAAAAVAVAAAAALAAPASAGASSASSSTKTSHTTKSKKTTPCPKFWVPPRLQPGDVAQVNEFSTGIDDGWWQDNAQTRPYADAAAAHSDDYGLVVPDLAAGPAMQQFHGFNGAGTYQAAVFVRLAPETPDTVVRLRVLRSVPGEESVMLAQTQSTVSAAAWTELTLPYAPGWTHVSHVCNGKVVGAWDQARQVDVELTVADGQAAAAPVGLYLDDVRIAFVKARKAKPRS